MHSNPVPRRRHGAELKAKVLAACIEPGASIAAVALSHGLNANLVRNWLRGRGLKRAGIQAPAIDMVSEAVPAPPPAATPLLAADTRFLPIELTTPAPAAYTESAGAAESARVVQEPIRIELRGGPLHLSVQWPTSASGDCTAWLRELSSGLLK
jgi:transposase